MWQEIIYVFMSTFPEIHAILYTHMHAQTRVVLLRGSVVQCGVIFIDCIDRLDKIQSNGSGRKLEFQNKGIKIREKHFYDKIRIYEFTMTLAEPAIHSVVLPKVTSRFNPISCLKRVLSDSEIFVPRNHEIRRIFTLELPSVEICREAGRT